MLCDDDADNFASSRSFVSGFVSGFDLECPPPPASLMGEMASGESRQSSGASLTTLLRAVEDSNTDMEHEQDVLAEFDDEEIMVMAAMLDAAAATHGMETGTTTESHGMLLSANA